MNRSERRKLAKFRAGLILQSALNDWRPEDLIERHGQEEVDLVAEEISDMAKKMIDES